MPAFRAVIASLFLTCVVVPAQLCAPTGPYDASSAPSPQAAYDLGILYTGGIEIHRDNEYAKAFFLQAAEDKYAPALTALGDLVQKTARVPKPHEEIASYYNEAAALGHARAMYMMGRMTAYILPTNPASKSALQWFTNAFERGYLPAAYEIGKIYEQKRDYKKAYDYYLKASNVGITEATLALSDFFTFGRGVVKDKEKGLAFLEEAAEAGNPVARLNFGHALKKKALYFDLLAAGTWYDKAAENIKAARDLLEINRRTCLDRKIPVEQRARACPVAAATNDPAALFTLSALLRMDIPSPAHAREAHRWALKSAASGYEPARLLVMEDLETGYGTPIDKKAYRKWQRQSSR